MSTTKCLTLSHSADCDRRYNSMAGRKNSEPYYFHTLLELLKLGAKKDYTRIATAEVGERLGVTQQAASFQLKELERLGLVSKRKVGKYVAVKITDLGLSSIASVYFDLKESLEGSGGDFLFHGTVFRGLGQGAFYIGMPKFKSQFSKLLGFVPYAGTLNVRLHAPIEIHFNRLLRSTRAGIQILAFEDQKSHEVYGPLKCFKAVVNDSQEAAIVFYEKTHYNDSVLEVISPIQLRKKLGLDRNDREITVKVSTDVTQSSA